MIRTFIDAGLLIAALRGTDVIAAQALAILDDPEREFASSEFLRLEILPKARYYRRTSEIDFYEAFFAAVTYWANVDVTFLQTAYEEACASGLGALDALHVAAPISVGATEFVTIEKPTTSLHRTGTIKVISIHDDKA